MTTNTYLIKEGYENLKKHGSKTFSTMLIICATMLVLGIFIVLFTNVNKNVETVKVEQGIQAFIEDTATESDIEYIKDAIEKIDGVGEIQYIDKDMAYEDAKNVFKDQEYSEETQKLLFDKISWKVKKVTAENDTAVVEIELTNKDFSEVLQNYKNKIWKDISSVIGKTIDTSRYFEDELKNENLGTKTITVNIKLQKQDGKWKVVANNELANSLLPGLQESVNAIQ